MDDDLVLLDWTSICRVLPLRGDVDEVFHWHFWMPEPGLVLRQVVYSFALCIPFALVLFLLARVSLAGAHLRVIAGAFAITGFPFYALCVGGPFALIGAFPAWFKMSALQIGLRVCIIMMYHNGFPVIGFLSTLGSGLDLKLSSDRASRATGPA